MFRVEIINEITNIKYNFLTKTKEEANRLVETTISNYGLPEREILTKELKFPYTQRVIRSYDKVIKPFKPDREVDVDILNEIGAIVGTKKVKLKSEPEIIENVSIVKADCVYNIIDVSDSQEFVLAKAIENRKLEYPKVDEFVHAYFDGGLEELEAKREEVKKKFPLPNLVRKDRKEFAWKIFRNSRNKFLLETDYTQLPDAPLTSLQKSEYREYRKYLRDLPKAHNDNSIWSAKVLSFDQWRENK